MSAIGGTVGTFLSDARYGVTLVDWAPRHSGREEGVVGQVGGGEE